MAAGRTIIHDSNQAGKSDKLFAATIYNAGTLNGSFEGIVGLPSSPGGWELTRVKMNLGANTTHTTTVSVTVTVEKNTDGGAAVLSANGVIDDTAGTGAKVVDSDDADSTGITVPVIKTDGTEDFNDDDVAFVTVTEAGTGGADPSDVSVTLEFTEIQDFDPQP